MDALRGLSKKASSSSLSQFLDLPKLEFDVLTKIVALTPANTTTFNALLEPYHEVLKQYDIDHRSDEKIYTLLLKLSLVPGSNWRQKWHLITQERQFSPVEAKGAHRVHAGDLPQQQTQHLNRNVRNGPMKNDAESATGPVSNRSRLPNMKRAMERLDVDAVGLSRTAKSNVSPGLMQATPRKSVHFLPSALNHLSNPKPTRKPETVMPLQVASNTPHLVDKINILAHTWRHQQTLRKTFFHWKWNLDRWRRVGKEVQRVRGLLDLSAPYEQWKSKQRAIKLQLVTVERVCRIRLLMKSLDCWRQLTIKKCDERLQFFRLQACDEVQRNRNQVLMGEVLIRLKNAEKSTMERRDYNIGRYVIRYWVILERGRFLEHIRDTRCLQYHIGVWVAERRGIQSRLQAMHTLHIEHRSMKALRTAWLSWHQRLRDARQAEKIAEEWCRAKTLQHFLRTMKICSEQIAARYIESHQIRIHLTRHRLIKIWRKKTRKKRVARWLQMCKRRRVQEWYNLWIKLYRQKKYEVIALQKLHTMARLRICRTAFEVWHFNAIFVIDCDLKAMQVFRRRTIHTYTVRWAARKHDLSDSIEIALHFSARNEYVAKKQLFLYWLSLTRRLRENQVRLDRQLSNERNRLLCNALKWWREVLCERRLTDTENAVRSRGEKIYKSRTLQTWIARSGLITILRSSRKSCALAHLQIWRTTTREKLDRMMATKIDHENLSKVYFARWLQNFLDIKASKMINRFRYPTTLKRGLSYMSGNQHHVETDEEIAPGPGDSLMMTGTYQANGYNSTLSSLMQRPNRF
ncbi:uncharacterized protein MELLADRAFT_118359 [Melampsora larici-populina 98AG31]|uniref:Sfi1 spindle body domain-containing protein n=1 Tax=Melampsora larici-populina (strain 98AG31 / pathotype 3-4-7) TaxID=747676 RepID=F4S868_MELLP|nr:uncharacterized protein MELLADRAFT_118359 [Melampsora larici-populina 98AG31]EGF99134.1 hypothetical protein MELLADRAFT_118359 [Melampsora larici-populina 98AG31]